MIGCTNDRVFKVWFHRAVVLRAVSFRLRLQINIKMVLLTPLVI